MPLATSSSRAARFHEHRRRPRHRHVALRAPPLLAGLRVERDEERLVVAAVVTLEDHQVLVEHGRRRRAHADGGDVADVGFPGERAVEVVGVEALGAEVGVDPLAVGDRRRRRVAALLVTVVVDRTVVGGALPERLAGWRGRGPSPCRCDACRRRPSRDGRTPCRPSRWIGALAPGARSPSTAVVRKTRSPQTMGDEWPRPPTGTFQATFCELDHSVGRPDSAETPCPSGPRQPRPVGGRERGRARGHRSDDEQRQT